MSPWWKAAMASMAAGGGSGLTRAYSKLCSKASNCRREVGEVGEGEVEVLMVA